MYKTAKAFITGRSRANELNFVLECRNRSHHKTNN